MALKILTVDDSRAVRIIVKKAFKSYDCEISEAANGVEGLAAAAKVNPDLILLDVTMPVMDGVEMLTKLKAEAMLKNIPVIMLTAEAGRDNVLKIAKIGIRDYVVKPFKEDQLIEKVGRVIDLRPIGDGETAQKSIDDKCAILVVEDQSNIITQIENGLSHTPWDVTGVNATGAAIDFCNQTVPDVIIISLSLSEDAASSLFRILRSNIKTKYVPVFGLAVKTDLDLQQQAQQLGFTSIITKPIDFSFMENKIAKAINLDTSARYFVFDEDYMLVKLPEEPSTTTLNEVGGYLKSKISDAVNGGRSKVIVDVHRLSNVNMNIIKLMVDAMQICRSLTLGFSLVGNEKIAEECKGFEESKNWVFHNTVEEAQEKSVSAN